MSSTPPPIPKEVRFASALLNVETMLPAAIEWIQDNMEPQDVFGADKLEAWARAAGFVRVS